MEIKHGCTRLVILTKKYVIKVPQFKCGWNNFIQGILANINERIAWDVVNCKGFDEGYMVNYLCPILRSNRLGLYVIMPRADMNRHLKEVKEEPEDDLEYLEQNKLRYRFWIENGFGGDDKPDNYGYIDDRLVKIDYGSNR